MKMMLMMLMFMIPMTASSALPDLFSDGAKKYMKDRASETRVGYTISFNSTSGGATYLPLRHTKDRFFEGGVGYHHQEQGVKNAFLFAGVDLMKLIDKIFDGPPLPPVYVHTWCNLYQGKTWIVGQEVGVMASMDLFKFK